jgi:hypothetical protein
VNVELSSDGDTLPTPTDKSQHLVDIPEQTDGIPSCLDPSSRSRGLEIVFTKMMERKFGLHFRPSSFILQMLYLVFGPSQSRKTHCLSLALPLEEEVLEVESKEKRSIWSEISNVWDETVDKEAGKLKGLKLISSAANKAVFGQSPEGQEAVDVGRIGIDKTPQPPIQSPGLLLHPDTFIPMSPGELEMHVCKFIHIVLGSKNPLSDFVSEFTDEKGQRLMKDDELNDLFSDYEW